MKANFAFLQLGFFRDDIHGTQSYSIKIQPANFMVCAEN